MSKARNLADIISGAYDVPVAALGNVPPSDDASALTTGTLPIDRIADGAVVNAKIASGVDASKLTTGTLPIARVADGAVTNAKIASGVDASKLTTGTLPVERLPSSGVNASALTTGTLPIARIADGAVTNAKIASGVDASKLTTGTLPVGRLPSSGVNASSLTTGTLGTARLPAGNVIKVQHNVCTVLYTATASSYVQVTAFNQTFTPTYASSKVLCIFNTGVNMICDGNVALTRNGQVIKDTWFGASRADNQYDYPQATGLYLDSPATTSTVTYGIQVRATGCSHVIGIGGGDNHQSWTFMEIAA